MLKLHTGPFQVKLSLLPLKRKFEELLDSTNAAVRMQAKEAIRIMEAHPVLINGTYSLEEFLKEKDALYEVMAFLFPTSLTLNEIKAAILPYMKTPIYCSERLQNIIDNVDADVDIFSNMYKDYDDSFDIMTYAIILNSYYNYHIDFDRPKTIAFTNKNGVRRHYRLTFNKDFIAIYPNENAIEITEDILNELMANAYDKEVWEHYFPKNSWTIEGIGIVNLIDTTLDEQIDTFKTHLIEPNKESISMIKDDIRKIFNLPNLEIGSYQVDKDKIVPPYDGKFNMLTLDSTDLIGTNNYACEQINELLFKEIKPVVIANVEYYSKKSKNNRLSQHLLKKGYKSVALIPITVKGELAFIIELAAYKINQLNAINMVKLDTIMPFILSYSARTVTELENEISAVIQQECTSIHPSVEWRFEEEALKYIQERNHGTSPQFEEIVFKDVLPLYGQVDIVGSSNARNIAIQQDLTKQLKSCKQLLKTRLGQQNLPFFEQLIYQIDKYLFELGEDFHTNSEQEVNLFFENQLLPLLHHLQVTTKNTEDINQFIKALDPDTNTLYLARKAYDCTVDSGNKLLSSFLEKQQQKAQEMFPHYFEKFKTDGIEHNLYIGQSIAKNRNFHSSDLYNLRLWQLQVSCELEAIYYQKNKEFPLQLEVASLILAYDVPITIRYRMDEKQFDVDGAYNVHYEMIKKRIDKAHIKNTNERLTQAHKLSVVYSSSAIEREYLAYFEFLQSKGYIGKKIEIVELEELQGASGIKAIRADINHDLEKVSGIFTVKDLQSTY